MRGWRRASIGRRAALARWLVAPILAAGLAGCASPETRATLTFSGSALGPEAELARRQLARFQAQHPEYRVELRVTPDAADQRHQLYVQWLNAHVAAPDVLQLDVVWTAEFAAAGWIIPVDIGDSADFVPAAIAAARWRGRSYAVPWFVDVGLLYWRTDLLDHAPRTLGELQSDARRAVALGQTRFGIVWQGARYEGLATVFLEYLSAFGGAILDERGQVAVDQPAAVRALTLMCDAVAPGGYVPPSALTWQEEQVRFAFQNGESLFMRNWPYAYPLLQEARSSVRGRFAVAALPGTAGGHPSAALGGAQLAVNAYSRQPAAALALVRFLTAPEQMLERARGVGQLPARRSLYSTPQLADALPIPLAPLQEVIEAAVARPATPVYTELSEILQVRLHRALSRQQTPAAALGDAAAEIRQLLARSGLSEDAGR